MKGKIWILGIKNKRLAILIILLFAFSIFFVYSNLTKKEIIIKRFVKIYCSSGVKNKAKWLGIRATQNPCDMWAMQEIITEIKPDFIIETGTFLGGSDVFFASILQNVNPQGKVITVDITDYRKDVLSLDLFKNYVEFIQGDSVSDEVINKITKRIERAKTVMVTLDSDHSKKHVLKELQLYSRFVTKGSYLIVQDTHLDGWHISKIYKQGPMMAMREFLKENKNFVIDYERNKFLLTWFPQGFLKRIR